MGRCARAYGRIAGLVCPMVTPRPTWRHLLRALLACVLSLVFTVAHAVDIPPWVIRGIALEETSTVWRDLGDVTLSPLYKKGTAGEVGPWQLHPLVLQDLDVADQAARIHTDVVYAESLTRFWLLHLFRNTGNWRDACAAFHVGLAGLANKEKRARGHRYAARVRDSGTLQ